MKKTNTNWYLHSLSKVQDKNPASIVVEFQLVVKETSRHLIHHLLEELEVMIRKKMNFNLKTSRIAQFQLQLSRYKIKSLKEF